MLIPKYGLEGTLFLRAKDSDDSSWVFDEEEPSQTCAGVKISLFQPVTVQVSLDTRDVQHEKLALRLVSPVIPGFSVPPAPPMEEEKTEGKRTADQEENSCKKKKLES